VRRVAANDRFQDETTDEAARAAASFNVAAVYHDHATWRVFCFTDPAHAALFREKFGGEPFDPRDRGRGAAWARWRKPQR
jgi:hypothetical protein